MSTERPPTPGSWAASGRPMARRIARPLREFLQTEAAGGIVLLAAALVALVWANSPFSESYFSLWSTEISLRVGEFELQENLRHWVNDGLMTIFFFVVGLEIKRELVVGELRTLKRASLPIIAAVGGMAVPAIIYAALNADGAGSRGWGIPMATDIAFAVGVLALFGSRVSPGLKAFLLTLAIADDIGAIIVIAVFYSGGVEALALGVAIALLLTMLSLRRMRILWMPLYVLLGTGVWLATLQSGVHATIAGVALGVLAPARALTPGALESVARMEARATPAFLRFASRQARESVSVVERVGYDLHPWSSYLIVPIFALANAGVELTGDMLSDAVTSPVTTGIFLGLVVGKLVGITGFSWMAYRLKLGELPEGVGWNHLTAVAAVAGIGFTVSLFIAGLAFEDPILASEAKVGIFAGSLIAAVIGALLFRRAGVPRDAEGSREVIMEP